MQLDIFKPVSRLAAGLLACLIISGTAAETAAAADSAPAISDETLNAMCRDYYSFTDESSGLMSYSDYYELYSQQNRPEREIVVKGTDFTDTSDGSFSTGSCGGEENVLLWESHEGRADYVINVEESGIYCVNIKYYPFDSATVPVELSMEIDEAVPFDTASRIRLNRAWVNSSESRFDSRGNQMRPVQIQQEMWLCADFCDSDGLFSEPLIFYLEAGSHKISFTSERAGFAVESFKFYTPEKLPEYAENDGIQDTPANIFRIEGEDAAVKSDSEICPAADGSCYTISPSDPVKILYNTIGGGNWKKPMQSVTWTIRAEDIKNDGWYKIGIKARQNQLRGFSSARRIYIDGKVPCQELSQVCFPYDNRWQLTSPCNQQGDYIYVYLTADCDHTLTLEAVPGETADSLRELDKCLEETEDYYSRILMITGPNPDKYTDYYVHEKIPELVDELDRLSGELKAVQAEIEGMTGTSGSEAAAIERMTVILDKCVEKPLRIPDYLSQIKENITSLSAWSRECRSQPLEIDYIEFAAAGCDFSDTEEHFLQSLKFGAGSFFGSFFEDYSTLSDVTGEDAVEVWVNLGRDQAQAVREMTESQFMAETGIPVSISLVNGGIIEAALADKAPDVVLFFGGETPVNLAARGLLADLTGFSGYEDVKERFGDSAFVQYTYENCVYGLPLSRNFPMLFYRTDILAELGFDSPPETWDELIEMLPAMQRRYMSAGLVLPSANISPATEAGHTFALLTLQNNVSYYNETLTDSCFDSAGAVDAFETWTDFYTKYSFQQSYDAFSRFRTGEYPLVINNYTFANQLTEAAPEISGLWDFVQVPGTLQSSGTVSHAANSNGTAAVIFSKAENKEGAWEFLKWFTETETQVQFGSRLEGLMGVMGRYDTANNEALGQLSWSSGEYSRLADQIEELEEIPIIPASYAVTRNIMNAFREVVNEKENPRDTLIWYNRDISEEIKRKSKNLIK